MALHDTIRARRKELGLSQEYLAEQLGISRQAVAKWEAGKADPPLPFSGAGCCWNCLSLRWWTP